MNRDRFSYYFCFAASLFSIGLSSLFGQETPVNFKIAFIGDQGLGETSVSVLQLIKSEGADAVVHSGDFDYDDNPAAWDTLINNTLGEDFPYFACMGNHDKDRYFGEGGYQEFMEARLNRLGITWDGDLGVRSSLKYNGIFLVLTAPGTLDESDYFTYIGDKLAEENSIWSISSWHKNMTLMQVGEKSNDTGWEVYEASRKGGAIIATAHEHSYCRTYLLSNIEDQIIASTSDTLILTKDLPDTEDDEGKSFVFVSGLGGKEICTQARSGDWWASIYTADQDAKHGALFGTFNLDGVPNLAKFYFKDIEGVIPDSFVVISDNVDMPVSLVSDDVVTPVDFSLSQNYPNPFNPQTEIQFAIPEDDHVELKIFNIFGKEVRTLTSSGYQAGFYSISWDGTNKRGRRIASGIYFYRLQAGDFLQVKKMSLIR